MSTREWLG